MPQEKVWYKRNKESEPKRAKFILQKGQNAAVLGKKGKPILADADQFRTRFKPEDIDIPEEDQEETEEEEYETEQNMEEKRE